MYLATFIDKIVKTCLICFILCSFCTVVAHANQGSEENEESNLSGFVLGVKGFFGLAMPSLENTTSYLVQKNYSSNGKTVDQIEGGGGVTLGVRFGLTSLDIKMPLYMRLELEYGQRAPSTIKGTTEGIGVRNADSLVVQGSLGIPESSVDVGVMETTFSVKNVTHYIGLNMFLDIDTRTPVIPYVGLFAGISLFDVQLQSPLQYFVASSVVDSAQSPPKQEVYGFLQSLKKKSLAVSFMWGVGIGMQILINEYFAFDMGIRYMSNGTFSTGRDTTLKFSMGFDYAEMMFGFNVVL